MLTIFDNVVSKENDHTELVRNLMDRSPQMAARFLSRLTEASITAMDAAKLTYRTQQSFAGPDGRQIPDIVVLGEDFQCLIEVKVDPELGLTPKQLVGYASCFSMEKVHKHLCFLVPNDWKHSHIPGQIRDTLRDKHVHVHRCYWQDLIPELSECVAMVEDGLLKEVVSFWRWRFEISPMTLEEREFMKTWSGEKYRAMQKLEKTIDQAKKLFDARQHKTESETDVTAYGFYVKRGDLYLLWIGIWDAAPAPLSYGYQLESPHWLKPLSIPSGGTTVPEGATTPKNRYHLWALPQEAWDNAEKVYALAASWLDTCLPKVNATP
ncbi:PD-(D/E)XK nuclease family protein [Acidicapsa dinghuensis]|uniref:PD-(D/E)XK nuclease family protein n=1 Tax=Acidicapsa dinghuensis TaxID=2218256 RepID=A0ABW1ECL1_9BACT|nr:PD-(D/E)XK nuclease family protein [Acidicapsa dinghuensis]